MSIELDTADIIALRPLARRLDVPDAAYYADPCSQPSLSQSTATMLINESPKHAWLEHPRLGGQRKKSTEAMSDGTVIHSLLLGKPDSSIEVVDCKEFRSNADKALRDAAIAAGKTPVKREHYERLLEVADTLRGKLASYGYDLQGEPEVGIEWTEPNGGAPVICRGKMDLLNVERGTILDVKTSEDVNPKRIKRKILDFGLDIQRAAYVSALSKLHPELEGRIRFEFLFLEITPPYSIVPIELDGAYCAIGENRWAQAVRLWQRCLSSGHWPEYTDRRITVEPEPWVMREWLVDWTG